MNITISIIKSAIDLTLDLFIYMTIYRKDE